MPQEVVWYPLLQAGTEGPTLISNAASSTLLPVFVSSTIMGRVSVSAGCPARLKTVSSASAVVGSAKRITVSLLNGESVSRCPYITNLSPDARTVRSLIETPQG